MAELFGELCDVMFGPAPSVGASEKVGKRPILIRSQTKPGADRSVELILRREEMKRRQENKKAFADRSGITLESVLETLQRRLNGLRQEHVNMIHRESPSTQLADDAARFFDPKSGNLKRAVKMTFVSPRRRDDLKVAHTLGETLDRVVLHDLADRSAPEI